LAKTADAAPARAAMASAADLPTLPPQDKRVSWTLPRGWTEQPPSNMRAGSFLVKDGARTADISIVPLNGDAGGDLSNVNRWRGQIGLTPISAAELDRQSEIIAPAGRRMRLVDIANGGKRLVATIYGAGDKTWFFKMTGDDALVKATKPAFLKFLESVKIDQ
jgi:hypothetical protein